MGAIAAEQKSDIPDEQQAPRPAAAITREQFALWKQQKDAEAAAKAAEVARKREEDITAGRVKMTGRELYALESMTLSCILQVDLCNHSLHPSIHLRLEALNLAFSIFRRSGRKLLKNTTHPKASSIWLDAPSGVPPSGQTVVYRPMGDSEILHLVQHNRLPETQPYQAIIEDEVGREYAEKYLNGKKRVDTNPTTAVEFMPPKALIEELFKIQHKIEDGVLSIGLGNKAGGGVTSFNDSIASGPTTWRIVKVKRAIPDR